MRDQNVASTSDELPVTGTGDLATILSRLPTSGAGDFATKVIEVYQQVMKVYGPSEQSYRAAVQVGQAVNGFSTSTNR